MFPQSSKFWRASDAFFASAARSRGVGRSAWGYYYYSVWDEWVRKSRKPERKRKVSKFYVKHGPFTFEQDRVLGDFRGVSRSRSTLNPNMEVAISMRMDGRAVENILDIAGSVGPIVTEHLDTALASIAFNAWRKWPTKTKLSKALLSLEYQVLPGGILQGSVHSNAWYTYYIKSTQHGLGGKQPHRVLIFQPTDRTVRRAAEGIAQQIQRYANGGKL